jgi:hypothetical protein
LSKAFTPIGIVLGLVSGQVAKKIFSFIWSRVDDEDAPDPKFREIKYVKLVIALIVEGAIARLVRGLVDHGSRHAWLRTAGSWPGEERPEPK